MDSKGIGATGQRREDDGNRRATPRGLPTFLIVVFLGTLCAAGGIAVLDMLSTGSAPAAGQRAPSWPGR
ncbi:MAG: hypothetical protein ABJE95_19290 [Byssovorax sp.]